MKRFLLGLIALSSSAYALQEPTPLEHPQESQPQVDQAQVNRLLQIADMRANFQTDEWFDEGDFLKAAQLMRVRAELFPNNYEIWSNLGYLLQNTGQVDAEIASYIRFHESNPQDPNSSFPAAEWYFNKFGYLQVIRLLEPEISRTPPPHANSFRILAHSYNRVGLMADSLRIWNKYLEVNPSDEAAVIQRDRVRSLVKNP